MAASSSTGRRLRNPFAGVTALAYALPNPARSASRPSGARRQATTTGGSKSMGKKRGSRRRRNVLRLTGHRKVGVTKRSGRTVWKGKGLLKGGKRTGVRRWVSVKGSAKRKASYRQYPKAKPFARRRNASRGAARRRGRRSAGLLRRNARGQFVGRKRNASRRRTRKVTSRRRRRNTFLAFSNPSKRRGRGRGRSASRRGTVRRKRNARGQFVRSRRSSSRRRSTSRRRNVGHVTRRRNGGRSRSLARSWSRGGRRRNLADNLIAKLPKVVQPVARAIAPGVVGLVGLAGGRWASGKVQELVLGQFPTAPVKVVAPLAAGAVLGVGAAVLPRIKQIPSWVTNAALFGLGLNFASKLLGALLPPGRLADFLLGVEAPAVPAAGYGYGFRGYNVTEAGLLGAGYGMPATGYAPIQGGVGAYVPDGTPQGGIGSYVAEPLEGVEVEEAPAGLLGPGGYGMGAYVSDPSELGAFVEEAPAGFGDYHGGDESVDDADIEDAALDAGEASLEGLGGVHAQVRARGGHLLHVANEESVRILASKGMDCQMVKQSTRHPGVAIVSAVPRGHGFTCPHCGTTGTAPAGVPVFRCYRCAQPVSQAVAARQPMRQLAPPRQQQPMGMGAQFAPMWATA